MPIFLLLVGTLFLVAAVRGEEETSKLLALLRNDFTGSNNFIFWAVSIWGVAALGYFPALRVLSRAFVALIIIRLLLSHADSQGNFFTKLMQQISVTEQPAPDGSASNDPLGFTKMGLSGSGAHSASGITSFASILQSFSSIQTGA